ncbi:MAG: DNA-directed RNA polymerase subunit H [Thermoplasmata archaeon HGW-Thermoplasmata-1]|nr:MAG: DNA-directed RNA polymerase subunit H [Thermoplasmata archaeon HGW-Thermoplasmata-1]
MSDFNVLKHNVVPYHEVLSDADAGKVLEVYGIKPDQLPKILDTDPVARAIGAKPGQVIRVIRQSRTAGEAVAYRLVISASGTSLLGGGEYTESSGPAFEDDE